MRGPKPNLNKLHLKQASMNQLEKIEDVPSNTNPHRYKDAETKAVSAMAQINKTDLRLKNVQDFIKTSMHLKIKKPKTTMDVRQMGSSMPRSQKDKPEPQGS